MTNDPNRAEITEAVIAMRKARSALLGLPSIPPTPRKVTLRRALGEATVALGAETPSDVRSVPGSPSDVIKPASPTHEALEAAQEAALEAFPEGIRAAARSAFEELRRRAEGKAPLRARYREFEPPSPIPKNVPQRPLVEETPFPPAGLDDPAVRAEWGNAHRAIAEGRFRLQPSVLRAYAEASLAREKWDSQQRGRKPSGDLRHPVPRDRLTRTMVEMTLRHERDIARAASVINSIEAGDVVRVEFFDPLVNIDKSSYKGGGVPILILQSEVNRMAAKRRERANRTQEEIEADKAKWDEMAEEILAELPPAEPELMIPNLPALPIGRQPTAFEVASLSNAIRDHLNYVKRGEQIEAKRKREAATKVRTSAKREAERADPAGAAEANKAVKLIKAAERQRRWRERKKVSKDTDA